MAGTDESRSTLTTGNLLVTSADNAAAELSTTVAITIDTTTGAVGTAANSVQFVDNQDEISVNTTSGDVFLQGLGSLTVTTVQSTAGGNIDVRADTSTDTLTVFATGGGISTTGGAETITLSAAEGINVNDSLTTAAGLITLNADSDADATQYVTERVDDNKKKHRRIAPHG